MTTSSTNPVARPTWADVWRRGFCPSLPTVGLEALRQALRADDPRLLQGATTAPPPLACVQDWPCEAADPVAFCFWQDHCFTTGEVEEAWARACYDCDQALGEPAGCRWLLNWVDETPRDEMRRLLLVEVEAELERRVANA